ncbi:hypothetical protein MF672_029130 [Actinomadura sp. ATCC 31491]|uniref:PhnB-like domain-containing protein n=1 Tax=Actinomadura luzonensis TaxID=2805427 RepID=A0ABT0FZX4_9ACTN|nr:hypothetical protein [Actinomadura luzonensis]MCK2217829.1 hypothetical protein [Actinomadura luzonensis]
MFWWSPKKAWEKGTQPGRFACERECRARPDDAVHPLGPAQWAPLYGMLKDRFGVTWVVDVAASADGAS